MPRMSVGEGNAASILSTTPLLFLKDIDAEKQEERRKGKEGKRKKKITPKKKKKGGGGGGEHEPGAHPWYLYIHLVVLYH